MATANEKKESSADAFAEILKTPRPLSAFKSYKKSNENTKGHQLLSKFQGSLLGLAVGDALGAHVEFRPRDYLEQHPVKEMQGGGTWGLDAGKWTDDTTMTLCLAASLVEKRSFDVHDQFKKYRQWLENGYLSSVDRCFDIGKATRESIQRFIEYEDGKKKNSQTSTKNSPKDNLEFGASDAAGNGSLMRVAPIPLFLHQRDIKEVLECVERETKMTHGDIRAIQASQYFAYLIYHALKGADKTFLLDGKKFCQSYEGKLHPDVEEVILGSYKNKKNGYEDGIRGQGLVVKSLEAALWAFSTDDDSFETGVRNAVNLGDDTDTTAAIYGQLAGAYYGIDKIPERWCKQLFQCEFIKTMATELFNRALGASAHKSKSEW